MADQEKEIDGAVKNQDEDDEKDAKLTGKCVEANTAALTTTLHIIGFRIGQFVFAIGGVRVLLKRDMNSQPEPADERREGQDKVELEQPIEYQHFPVTANALKPSFFILS